MDRFATNGLWITRNYLSRLTLQMQSTSQLPQIVHSVQKGVRWLKGNAEALTDARDIAITISTLIAAEKNRHSQLVQRLVAVLVQKQAVHGSWNDELWDTVWAAKALHDAGHEIQSFPLRNALRFLEDTQDPFTGTWYEEPFETMLVLDLIARIAPEKMVLLSKRACEWVASLQKPDGCVIGIRYTGMAASLFCLTEQLKFEQGKKVKELALEYIRRDIQNKTIWTAAAWSNYYPLKALIDCGVSLDDMAVEKAITWFLNAQAVDGKWLQVSQVHDTSMAILVLSSLLTSPLVDVSDPRIGVLNAFKENGTIRVGFHGPDAGAITPAERMKISDQVRSDLSQNQHLIATAMRKVRGKQKYFARKPGRLISINTELEKTGKYAYGHLIPARIQSLLSKSSADHLRLDIDERLIDLPWELVHDGNDFLCLRYAVGRRLVSDQDFLPPHRHPRAARDSRVLIVADPTGDLPAAKREGRKLANLLRDKCHMQVDEFTASGITKKDFLLSFQNYDIVHFAGHASHDPNSPDESSLLLADGEIQAFEIARFITTRSPAVVFLNACWSAEELRDPDSYSPMMRGLGRTFLYAGVTAFLGYLIPVPDASATHFAIYFYNALVQGYTVGESLRRSRIQSCDPKVPYDVTWSSAILYGDPTARIVEVATLPTLK